MEAQVHMHGVVEGGMTTITPQRPVFWLGVTGSWCQLSKTFMEIAPLLSQGPISFPVKQVLMPSLNPSSISFQPPESWREFDQKKDLILEKIFWITGHCF